MNYQGITKNIMKIKLLAMSLLLIISSIFIIGDVFFSLPSIKNSFDKITIRNENAKKQLGQLIDYELEKNRSDIKSKKIKFSNKIEINDFIEKIKIDTFSKKWAIVVVDDFIINEKNKETFQCKLKLVPSDQKTSSIELYQNFLDILENIDKKNKNLAIISSSVVADSMGIKEVAVECNFIMEKK